MIRNRKLPRLSTYDYSLPGSYFITICSHEKRCTFGAVRTLNEAGKADVVYSALGKIVQDSILDIETHYPNIRIDNWVIMPNHVHLLVSITHQVPGSSSIDIPNVVGKFKASVTRNAGRYHVCAQKVWQSSYYDHVVRNDDDYQMIWNYISGNPSRWQEDRLFSP